MEGDRDLLNEDELAAMDLSAELANLCRKICCQEVRAWKERHPDAAQTPESQQDHDWAELAQYIHMIQTKIMSQAAARAYPGKFRLIGEVRKR
jgi:hypothetical protein